MTTTILKVLRDCKLTDGTQLRLGITGEHIELSTVRGLDNILSAIHLPDTIETALELMSIGDKLLRKNLEKDKGSAYLYDKVLVYGHNITQERLDNISKQMDHNGYILGETYGYNLGSDWVGSSVTSNIESSSIWWKNKEGSHSMYIHELPNIPDGIICGPFQSAAL